MERAVSQTQGKGAKSRSWTCRGRERDSRSRSWSYEGQGSGGQIPDSPFTWLSTRQGWVQRHQSPWQYWEELHGAAACRDSYGGAPGASRPQDPKLVSWARAGGRSPRVRTSGGGVRALLPRLPDARVHVCPCVCAHVGIHMCVCVCASMCVCGVPYSSWRELLGDEVHSEDKLV